MIFHQLHIFLILLNVLYIFANNLFRTGHAGTLSLSVVLHWLVYIRMIRNLSCVVYFVHIRVALMRNMSLASPQPMKGYFSKSVYHLMRKNPVPHFTILICVSFCVRVAVIGFMHILGTHFRVMPAACFSPYLMPLGALRNVRLVRMAVPCLRSCSSLSLCLCLSFVANRPAVHALSVRLMVYFVGGAR